MDEFTALLGNLTRTCQELEEIKQEQAKDHERISKSFERALLSILRQEQSILNQVEEEHGQLKAKLTSLQRVNEQALQEGVSEINSMVQQIARVSSQLQALKSTKENTAIMKKIHENITEIFARKKSIIIRLKKVQFSPSHLHTPALGEIHYEEQTFGFSIPYVEGTDCKYASAIETTTPTLLTDETPPWDITSSDSGSTDNGTVCDRTPSPIKDDTDSGESERKSHRHQPIQKSLSRDKITREETVVISPRARSVSDTESNALSPRTVNKIRISDAENSSSSPDSEETPENARGAENMILGRRSTREDRAIHKHCPSFPRHTCEETLQNAEVVNSSQISAGKTYPLEGNAPGKKATRTTETQRSQDTQTGSSDLRNQQHSSEITLQNVPMESTHFHMKNTKHGNEVSSHNRGGFHFSSTLEGRPSPCLEQVNTRLYSVNYSKATKREHEEHASETKQSRATEPASSITKITSQGNRLQPYPLTADKQTVNNLCGKPFALALTSNQDSVFRATTAFVYEGDSDISDDGPDGKKINEGEKDPKACRVAAIRTSRVPSAKKVGSMEQLSTWNSMDLVNNVELCSSVESSAHGPTESPLSLSDSITFQTNLFSRNFVDLSAQTKRVLHPQPDDQGKSFELSTKQTIEQYVPLSPRSPSPTESIKSSYTFIIESPRDDISRNVSSRVGWRSTSDRKQLDATPNQRARRGRPVIAPCHEPGKDKTPPQNSGRRQLDRTISDFSNNQHPGAPVVDTKRDHFANFNRASQNRTRGHISEYRVRKSVPRSSSMPVIDRIPKSIKGSSNALRLQFINDRRDSVSSTSSSRSTSRLSGKSTACRAVKSASSRGRASQYGRGRRLSSENFQQHLQTTRGLSKSESNLMGYPLEEDEGPYENKLIGQLSKFGSGRGELNLPHGIHTTLLGALYVVDYGNRRVQVMDYKGCILQQITLEAKNYFDIAVNNKGLVALTNSTDRTVEVYSKHGKLLQVLSKNLHTPRGITTNFRDEFVIADMRLGTISALTLDLTTGRQLESTIIPGFNKPYLVSANSQGLVAVSERGFDGGCCVKVLNDDWQVLRVLGLRGGVGPTLFNPWGVCVDNEGGILVADWGQTHSVIHYPIKGAPKAVVTDGLSSPRGLATLQDRHLLVADSMHNCIKVFQYK